MTSDHFASQSLDDWLAYIECLHPTEIELGLERVSRIAGVAGIRTQNAKVVLVGGTNGKGTTCATIESLLLHIGVRVGVLSSPHLFRYNERVRINGRELTDKDHAEALSEIEKVRGDTQLTYFEFSTLAALWLFRQRELDVLLLEVGLGGRLDATNLVEPDLSVITSIDLDHQEWLGDTRDEIAKEKAGIMRSGRPAIIGEPDAPLGLYQVAGNIGAELIEVNKLFSYSLCGDSWVWTGTERNYSQLPVTAFPIQNMGTALAAIECLGYAMDEADVRSVLSKVTLPGRFQQISHAPKVFLDVGHNPHATRYLADRLEQEKSTGRILAVCGMLKDKAMAATLQPLLLIVDHWYLGSLNGLRGANAEQLRQALPQEVLSQEFDEIKQAYLTALKHARASDVVIVFGSFYTVAEIIEQSEG